MITRFYYEKNMNISDANFQNGKCTYLYIEKPEGTKRSELLKI